MDTLLQAAAGIAFIVVVFLLIMVALKKILGWEFTPGESKRAWRAHSPSGTVPLGHCTFDEAFRRATRLGKISYVDEPNGLIFYDTHLGGPPPDKDSGI